MWIEEATRDKDRRKWENKQEEEKKRKWKIKVYYFMLAYSHIIKSICIQNPKRNKEQSIKEKKKKTELQRKSHIRFLKGKFSYKRWKLCRKKIHISCRQTKSEKSLSYFLIHSVNVRTYTPSFIPALSVISVLQNVCYYLVV